MSEISKSELSVEDNLPLCYTKYTFTFDFSPLPVRNGGIIGIYFPSPIDISTFSIIGSTFSHYLPHSQIIFLQLEADEFMSGDIIIDHIRNPDVIPGYIL